MNIFSHICFFFSSEQYIIHPPTKSPQILVGDNSTPSLHCVVNKTARQLSRKFEISSCLRQPQSNQHSTVERCIVDDVQKKRENYLENGKCNYNQVLQFSMCTTIATDSKSTCSYWQSIQMYWVKLLATGLC